MRLLIIITLLFISSLSYGQGIWNQVNGNSKFWRLKADSVLIVPRDTAPTNNAFYLGATVGDSGRLAIVDKKLWLHTGSAGWRIVGSDIPGNLLDSARRSNDTLYFRTTTGGEIAVKMEGIEIEGVNGLQDSLSARYTKTQADARFIQGNQSITLSGDVTGIGTTAITTALKNTGTAGTYTKVTTDPEGRVSSGTTLSAGDIPDLSATYIPITQKGAASGVASLGMDGKVPSSQLPTTGSLYQGTWNASTNTPTIADGVGTAGAFYRVNVAGTQNLGSGNISFSVGDDVIYNGSVWQRIPGGSAVNSVNGYTGDVVLGKADVGLGNADNTSDLAKPVSTATQTALNLKANSAITLTAGTGLTGGGNLTANRSFAVSFGTAAGTVAQGNDSRINNGQTAFGWGNHASAGYLTTTTGDARYPQLSGSYANPSWLSSLAWSKITGAPSSFPTSSDLSAVLTNGNAANNSIVLGSNGNANNYVYSVIRSVSGTNYIGALQVSGGSLPGAVITTTDGSGTNPGRILYVPSNLSAPRYSPDGGASSYDMWHSNNHPAGTTGSITYTGAEVPSSFSFNSAGHYTASGKRTLTAADIGAAPASASGNYFNNQLSAAQTFSGWATGTIRTQDRFQVLKNGSNSFDAQLQLSNAAGSRWANMQLNGDANPGLSFWIHNGTTSIKRMELFANGVTSMGTSLQVINNIAPSSGKGLELNGSTTLSWIYSYDRDGGLALPLKIQHTGGDTYINETAGNVGIGTTSPATKLHVNGDATISGTLDVNTINPLGSAATNFLTHNGGVVQARTPAQVLSDIGAAPASGSGSYINNSTSTQTANWRISGFGAIQRAGSNSVQGTFALYNADASRGFNLQLNADANSGAAFYLTDNTGAWAKRFEIFSTGLAQFYSNVTMSNPGAILNVAGNITAGGTITAPVLQSPSGDNLVLLANSAPTGAQVTLTTDGLGIGGMPGGTHTARLLVAGNAVANDAWVLDNNAGMIGEWFIDGANAMGLRTTTNHDLNFYANNQLRMEIGKEGVITTTAGIASHSRLVSTASAFTINPQDYVIIMEGMGTSAGDGVLITLPDPATNGGRLLEFHEYSASSWSTNYDIYQPVLSPLTTISGVMVIRAVNGKWRLVSKN